MTALVAHVARRQHRLRSNLVLYADAPLIAHWQLVIAHIQASDAGSVDGLSRSRPAREGETWVCHLDAVEIDLQAERNIGTGIVHVVALNAFVHDANPPRITVLPAPVRS